MASVVARCVPMSLFSREIESKVIEVRSIGYKEMFRKKGRKENNERNERIKRFLPSPRCSLLIVRFVWKYQGNVRGS